MGASVGQLWKAGRYAEAIGAENDAEAARLARLAHPFSGIWPDQLTPESIEASRRESWRLKLVEFPNGHAEVTAWRHAPDPEAALERAMAADTGRAERGEGVDRDANIKRACRRAKQRVRLLAKALGVDSLWTLTYRACVTDRELVLRHLDRFRRQVAQLLPGWRYVAVIETQERGALHVHLATNKLPAKLTWRGHSLKSWNVLRGIWRSIVRELGGNFDESAGQPTRWGKRKPRDAGGIARYIAGYVAKDMADGELNRKRFFSSRLVPVPTPYRCEWPAAMSEAELLEACYAALGDRLGAVWWDSGRRVFFAESTPAPPPGLRTMCNR